MNGHTDRADACTKTDLRDNVRAFHELFQMHDPASPTVPPDDVVGLRARLITEEYMETMRALFGENHWIDKADRCLKNLMDSTPRVDLPEFADGLADLMYVCEGSFLAFGIDSGPIHAEVQRSNMAKAGGPVREDGKRMKPAGWTPPDIRGEIDKQKSSLTDLSLELHNNVSF